MRNLLWIAFSSTILFLFMPATGSMADPIPEHPLATYSGGGFSEYDFQQIIHSMDTHYWRPEQGETPYAWRERVLGDALLDAELSRRLLSETADLSRVDATIRDAVDGLLYRSFQRDTLNEDRNIGLEEIQAEYERRLGRGLYVNPEKVKFRHIFIDTHRTKDPREIAEMRKKAEEIREKIVSGEDFETVARTYSDGSNPENKGVEKTAVVEDLNPAARDALLSLQPGEISDVVDSPYGFLIFQSAGIIPSSTTPLDEVRQDIRTSIIRNENQRDLSEAIKAKMDEITVDMNYEDAASAAPNDPVISCGTRVRRVHDVLRCYPVLATDAEIDTARLRKEQEMDLQILATLCLADERGYTARPDVQRRAQYFAQRMRANEYLSRQVEITPDDLREYFAENFDYFDPGKEYRIFQVKFPVVTDSSPSRAEIFLAREKARDTAEKAVERARSGEDLEQVATELGGIPSEGKEFDLGFIPERDLRSEMRKIIEPLKPGEISDPYRSISQSYLVTQIREVRPGKKPTLEDPSIRNRVTRLVKEKKKEELREELKKQILRDLDFRMIPPKESD